MTNKEVVQQVIQAFMDRDVERALELMSDDIQMEWPGYFALEPGKEAVHNFFNTVPEMIEGETYELIAEGDVVIGTGSIVTKHSDGEIRKSFFSDTYHMKDGKVKAITSYMVFDQGD